MALYIITTDFLKVNLGIDLESRKAIAVWCVMFLVREHLIQSWISSPLLYYNPNCRLEICWYRIIFMEVLECAIINLKPDSFLSAATTVWSFPWIKPSAQYPRIDPEVDRTNIELTEAVTRVKLQLERRHKNRVRQARWEASTIMYNKCTINSLV